MAARRSWENTTTNILVAPISMYQYHVPLSDPAARSRVGHGRRCGPMEIPRGQSTRRRSDDFLRKTSEIRKEGPCNIKL
jgi:hypothetical protein